MGMEPLVPLPTASSSALVPRLLIAYSSSTAVAAPGRDRDGAAPDRLLVARSYPPPAPSHLLIGGGVVRSRSEERKRDVTLAIFKNSWFY
uniref:Uncharacterized protein n=1 Tax=Oryza punctata TaxID=4537 RepID=A0A0E0KGX6_ORYPU